MTKLLNASHGWVEPSGCRKEGGAILATHGEVDVSIVVPAYNEENRIKGFLNRLMNFVETSPVYFEILIVADGCTDGTSRIVEEYSRYNSAVRLLTSDDRLGKGGGLKVGLNDSRGRIVLYMDADGSYDPEEIPRLLRALKNADCAVGSRAVPGAIVDPIPPWRRMIAGQLFSRLVRLLLLREIMDTQAGFKAFKWQVIDSVLGEVSTDGFDMDVQLLKRAKNKGFKLLEVPVSYRFAHGSKVNVLRDGFSMGLGVLSFWLRLGLERFSLFNGAHPRGTP